MKKINKKYLSSQPSLQDKWRNLFHQTCLVSDSSTSLVMTKIRQKGFTFIELILYIGIVAVVMTSLVSFAWNIIQSGTKSNTQQDLFAQARFISERINYEIRNASGINSVSSTSISLSTSIPATNPTVIDLSGGNIRITQGAGTATNLNGNTTTIPSFTFTNYTSADNKTKHIGYTFTLNTNYTSNAQEYKDTTTLESSAEVRSN